MLHNLAMGSLVVAIFSGTCAFGVGKGLQSIMRPIMYGALVAAVGLYVAELIA